MRENEVPMFLATLFFTAVQNFSWRHARESCKAFLHPSAKFLHFRLYILPLLFVTLEEFIVILTHVLTDYYVSFH